MMPALTRGQKILALVAILIVALYVTGVATQKESSGQVDPTQNGLVKLLGKWFGGPDQAEPGELSAPCLAQQRLTIKDSCVLKVAPSSKDLREIKLHAEQPVRLRTRAPHDDTMLDKEIAAGDEIKVTVDSDGGDVTFTCDSCVVRVGGSDG